MNTRLRRRLFLGALAGGGIIAASFAVLPLSPELRLKDLIRDRLPYLKISDEVLDKFSRDFLADPENHKGYLGTMLYAGQRAVHRPQLFPSKLPLFRFERIAISKFLMSTDFFHEGANVDRPLSYVAYNDPYTRGCANYFARL
jgi:hypothetical protein